jgi:Domain of unknown function (DUF5666)
MNAVPYNTAEEDWDHYEDEGEDYSLPRRPRRQFFNRASAALLALVLGVIGFYVGVRVEKSQVSNSTTSAGGGLASRLAALGGTGAAARSGAGTRGGAASAGASGSGASGAGASGIGASGTGTGGGGAGLRALFGGGGSALGGGSASFGTVSSIDGNTMYVTQTSGNVVKVTLSSATKVTKNVTVGKNAVRPGDAVVVSGAKSSDGSISATTLSDTGASPGAAAGGSSSSSSSSPTTGSSAVSSLFGGGGG